jgi:outer membrane protein TolC
VPERLLILLVAWTLAPGALTRLSAQEAPAVKETPLTLEQAQARAIDTSHRLAESRARQRVADAVVDARAAAQRPSVAASAGYTRTNHVAEFVVPTPTGLPGVLYPDVPNNYRTRLDLQWPIYSGGRTDALERAARAEASAVAAETSVAQSDLKLEVARAFWAAVTADASARVLEEGVARAQAHVIDVRERLRAGLVPPNEVSSAEAQESRQRMLLIEARTQRSVALADLGRLAGADAGEVLVPLAQLEEEPEPSTSIGALIGLARGARAERTALLHRVESATEQRNAALAGRRPSVAVAGGLDYARPNPRIFPRADRWDDSWDLGINVNWSLWDGGRIAADAAQASGLAEASRQRLAEFDAVLAVEVRQRTLEITSGRASVVAADDAVRAAQEAERVVGERFRAGVITQIEVLDAQFALLQAQLDRTRALANIRLAEARLARAIGQ